MEMSVRRGLPLNCLKQYWHNLNLGKKYVFKNSIHHHTPAAASSSYWDFHSSWSCIEWWSGEKWQLIVAIDTWQVKCEKWHVTHEVWKMTSDIFLVSVALSAHVKKFRVTWMLVYLPWFSCIPDFVILWMAKLSKLHLLKLKCYRCS